MGKRTLYPVSGERMKEAAEAAGLDALEVSKRLGVSRTAVYRWWGNRRRRMDLGDLERYAALVGRSVEWFQERPLKSLPPEVIERYFYPLLERLMEGSDLIEAWGQVTGQAEGLSEYDPRILKAISWGFRAYLNEQAGGPWGDLKPERRRSILEDFLAELHRTDEQALAE